MTDVGLTWHMTQHVKMFFGWNHAEFNNPVTYATGKSQTTSNIEWRRFQLDS
jgi:phosphate-selective porin OprO/OprP